MGRAARPYNKDTLLPERRESLPQVVVVTPVPVGLDRELADGDIGLRVHEHEWDPCAVVEAAFLVDVDPVEAGRGEELLDPVGEPGRPGGRVLEPVHGFGEAVEVVDGVVLGGDGVDGGDGGVPVAGDDEDGVGFLGEPVLLPGLEEMSGGYGLVDA